MSPLNPWFGFMAASIAAGRGAFDVMAHLVEGHGIKQATSADHARTWATRHVVRRELTTMRVLEFSNGLDGAYTAAAISSIASAAAALGNLETGLNTVSSARATLGAVISRLTSAGDNLTNIAQNLTESRSRIRDADYAQATTELARTMIIQQAGTAVLAQANQLPNTVLSLLR